VARRGLERGLGGDLGFPDLGFSMWPSRLGPNLFHRWMDWSPNFFHRWMDWDNILDEPLNFDLQDKGDKFNLRLGIPTDVPKDRLKVEVDEDILKVSGQHEREQKGRYHYTSFSRSMRLPPTVDKEQITASEKEGFLNVELPKTKAALEKSKNIPIQSTP